MTPTRQLLPRRPAPAEPQPTPGIVLAEPRPHPDTKWHPCVKQVASSGRYSGAVLYDRFQVLASDPAMGGAYFIVDHDAPDGLHRTDDGHGPVARYDSVGEAEGAVERLQGTSAPTWHGWKRGSFREQMARQVDKDFTAASSQALFCGGHPLTKGPLKLIHDAVSAGQATKAIYSALISAYPNTTYRVNHIDWYRRQLYHRGLIPGVDIEELEMPKTAKQVADPTPNESVVPGKGKKAALTPPDMKTSKIVNGRRSDFPRQMKTTPAPEVASKEGRETVASYTRSLIKAGNMKDEDILKSARDRFPDKKISSNLVTYYREHLTVRGV